MNQSFNAARWWLLVGKHWAENKKKYMLSMTAIAGLLFLWFIVILVVDTHRGVNISMQVSTYYTGLFVAGCLYASILFADLGSKTRGLNYLVMPASHLEKTLCALFYGVVVFFACYTTLFYLADFVMIKAGNAIAYNYWLKNHETGKVFEPQQVFNVFAGRDEPSNQPGFIFYLLLFYIVLQAAFIYGSVFFAKFSFIKTIISLLALGLFLAFIIGKVITGILPPGSYHHGVNSYQLYTVTSTASGNGMMIYSDAATDKLVTLPNWISDVLLFLLKYAFAPMFWMATYFRLKEKEI
ncbi:MAG: hypothetical protein ABIU63_08750 [Chitinophagaceae bacterium]